MRLWACTPGGRRRPVPCGADDMMDCPCHYRYHSATDKTVALLHAEEAALFLLDFGVCLQLNFKCLTGIDPSDPSNQLVSLLWVGTVLSAYF